MGNLSTNVNLEIHKPREILFHSISKYVDTYDILITKRYTTQVMVEGMAK